MFDKVAYAMQDVAEMWALEKIAKEKSKDLDEPGRSANALKGVLGTKLLSNLSGSAGIGGMRAILDHELKKEDPRDALEFKRILESKKYLRKGVKPIDFSDVGPRSSSQGNAYYNPMKRTIGGSLAGNSSTILAHELGHGSGGLVGHGGIGLPRAVVGGLGSLGGSLVHGVGGAAAGYKIRAARNKEELDKAEKLNKRVALGTLALQAPLLFEEARASIRGNALHKKMLGRGANKAMLGAAYGTYLANAALPTGVQYALNRRAANERRKKLES
jgi:hypothetical protein